MNQEMESIKKELATFIVQQTATEEEYERLALKIFANQFRCNQPYRRFCQQKGKTLRTVKTWRDIPAVPINAFKETTLSCIDPAEAGAVFMTSGTTTSVRGKHYHPDTEIYDLSMKTFFKQMVMQEFEHIKMGVLFPDESHMPNSSLAHYLEVGAKAFGIGKTNFYIKGEDIDYETLTADLKAAMAADEPFLLLGATYSLARVMDYFEEKKEKFALPKGSRLFDTGGFKSYKQQMTLDEFYDRLSETFGVPRGRCINMYGMTELSTEYYSKSSQEVPAAMYGPHWMRTRFIDPLSGEDVPKGECGVIVHYDLANYNSVIALLTEDMGYEKEDGFVLLGRVEGSEAKGCSLSLEEFMKAVGSDG